MTEAGHEFSLADTFCALAADSKSPDTAWFMKIKEGIGLTTNDYGINIPDGCKYLQVQLQWIPCTYKWKLQTKIFLTDPVL